MGGIMIFNLIHIMVDLSKGKTPETLLHLISLWNLVKENKNNELKNANVKNSKHQYKLYLNS